MLNTLRFATLALSLTWTLPTNASDPSPLESPILHRGFIYENAPFPECHASTLAETSQGIVCAWFGGTEERHPDVGIWFSRLGQDGKWSTPIEIVNGIQYHQTSGSTDSIKRYPCWNPILMQQPNGPLHLFFKVGPSPSTWWGEVMSSQDAGQTWSIPRRLPEGILGPIKNKGIWLKNGELLCPTSTEEGGPWRVYFERAKPPFTQWTRSPLLATQDGHGGIQPTILSHPDGRLQALCRCDDQGDRILESWSNDQGVNWTPLQPTSLPNPNSGIDGLTLADGKQLLIYNHTQKKGNGSKPRAREMINLAMSQSEGKWLACETLEWTKDSEFSYPAIIQSQDGTVHITYTWNRKKIAYLQIKPSALQGQPISNHDWPLPLNR